MAAQQPQRRNGRRRTDCDRRARQHSATSICEVPCSQQPYAECQRCTCANDKAEHRRIQDQVLHHDLCMNLTQRPC